MRKKPLRKRVRCPGRTICVVEATAEDTRDYWLFGPDTRNPWPNGDYYSYGQYQEPAYYTYDRCCTPYFKEYLAHEPDMLVDIGL